MVEESSQEEPTVYEIVFHSSAQSDLEDINVGWHESIYNSIERKLGVAPKVFGEPIKQTSNYLWRAKHSKVRIIYTIVETAKEVVILSIKNRAVVYERRHLVKLMRIAESLRKK